MARINGPPPATIYALRNFEGDHPVTTGTAGPPAPNHTSTT